jgi:hypothetical protein
MATISEERGKPADAGGDPADSDAADPRATAVAPGRPPVEEPPARDPAGAPSWASLAGAGALLIIGWGFILMANGFHLTAPVVFVCLGYLAGVAAVYSLFRTGAAATGAEDGDEAGWGRPVGARAELEREKKALLKAIKEAEFDLQMGKLSKADAEAMIGAYRAQALAVIREIDRKDGDAASVREQIDREVRARLAVAKPKKAPDAERRPAAKKGKKAQSQSQSENARSTAGPAEAAAEQTQDVVAEADGAEARAEAEAARAEAAAAQVAEVPAAVPPPPPETDPAGEPAAAKEATP